MPILKTRETSHLKPLSALLVDLLRDKNQIKVQDPTRKNYYTLIEPTIFLFRDACAINSNEKKNPINSHSTQKTKKFHLDKHFCVLLKAREDKTIKKI